MQHSESNWAAPQVPPDTSYARIERAIAFLRARRTQQPELHDLAAHIGLSESRTQRLFSRWAGISPKRFLQFLTVEHAKQSMASTGDLMSLSLDSGLSGAGRLHDLFVSMEAMSPGEFRRAATGVSIRYGTGETPFGTALIAFTARGICHLSFLDPDGQGRAHDIVRQAWPDALLEADPRAAAALLVRVFARPANDAAQGLSLWISGTNFQVQVWRALLRIPAGGLLSYGQLAQMVGRPGAARSVGSAVAHNPVAFLIPCHRVLRSSGEFGDYHWGRERKMAICAWEAAAADRSR
jgi:AraC family transcriptional regulator of adaptative response/methylated-DNA-[protein]-cysteine methyltransferase